MDQKLEKLNELEETPYNRDKLLDIGAAGEDLENMECGDDRALNISVFGFSNLV